MKSREITRELGQKLRVHFEKEKVTQSELAQQLNTRQSWISRIYEGDFGVRSRIARELCEKANIDFLDDSKVVEVIKKKQNIDIVSQQLLVLTRNDKDVLKKISTLLDRLAL